MQSTTVTVSSSTQTGGTVARPSYNTGNGFFVLNGQIYDANGNEFRIRGVNRNHYDSPSQPGMSNAGVNTVRMFMYTINNNGDAAKYMNVAYTQNIQYNEVPILTMAYFPDGTTVSCNSSTTELSDGVSWWVNNAATFAPYSKFLMINLANEWGPSNSTTWASSYETAIKQLRNAGYTIPLVIDAGGCGQDVNDLLNYATEVFNSDPQKNIIFSLHIYGNIPTADVAPDLAQLAALSKSAGMVFIAGEFGPGNNVGPSPTMTTPADVIIAAEANKIGWMPWAWDSNNLAGGASNNSSFSFTLNGPGIYTKASDLTTYGASIVLSNTFSYKLLAKPASIFSTP